jgi:DNA gyrase subunit A
MRYTECRLGSLALELMAGIDQETVDFTPNYDATSEEPTVLPSRFPNILVNGSQGIAVGMATNIPPHNLGEVIDATVHLLEHPEATPDDLMEFVKGPDFPTGALILGRQGILDASGPARGRSSCGPWPRSTRAGTGHPHRGHRDALPDVGGLGGEEDLRPGPGRRPRRHRRGPGRLVGGQDPPGHPLKRDANANVVLNNLFKQTPCRPASASTPWPWWTGCPAPSTWPRC